MQMTEYVLDTDNGGVLQPFANLTPFVQGYIEAAFWLEHNERYGFEEWDSEEAMESVQEGTTSGSIPMDTSYGDMTEETLRKVIADCDKFTEYAADLLEIAYDREGYDEAKAGHDFWLTRNGHGSGFWCRDPLEADGLGDRLSKRARKQGESDMYLGDDRMVYFT
jgi:hypothetical protein